MSNQNINEYLAFFKKAKLYLSNLKTSDGRLVIEGPRKAGFIGFIVTMDSLTRIYNEYVETAELDFLLTYKFSQDHLESFFGQIRSCLGSNNNPTVTQFKASYRKLVLGSKNLPYLADIIPQDSSTLIVPKDVSSSCNFLSENYDVEFSDHLEFYLRYLDEKSELHDNVLVYICGFLQKKLISNTCCYECRTHLKSCGERVTCDLIDVKNKNFFGSLTNPTNDITVVVKIVESAYMDALRKNTILTTPSIIHKITTTTLMVISDQKPKTFEILDKHAVGHKANMIITLSRMYLVLKLKHFCKTKNHELKDKNIRQKYCKLVLFKNQ